MRAKHVRSRRSRGSPKSGPLARFDPVGWPVIALLALAFAFGGGGSRYGLLNLVPQLFALGLLVYFVADATSHWRARPAVFKALVLATIALPFVQLLPLPPSIWQALPGGDLSLAARELAGADDRWFPISLDPQRTLIALAALVPPLALVCLLPARQGAAQMALRIIVAIGLANFLAGIFQVLSGQNFLLPYPIWEKGRMYGFFASHNTCGLFFVISLCALFGIHSDNVATKTRDVAIVAVIAAILVLGTILTQSRSSTALLLLPLGAFAMRYVLERRRAGKPVNWPAFGVAAVVVIGLVALALTNERILGTFVRFEDLDDQRPETWEDSLAALTAFLPIGAGIGSFDEVFQNFESLEHVTRTYARRAHNDYLEIGIEAGLIGYALVAGWVLWAGAAWLKGRRCEEFREVDAAGLALLSIAAQSVLDYPLRNQAVLCLAAVFVAMLAARATRLRDGVIEKD